MKDAVHLGPFLPSMVDRKIDMEESRNMSFAESLLASLAAGALSALLYALTKRYLIPTIRSHISDELDLSGQW